MTFRSALALAAAVLALAAPASGTFDITAFGARADGSLQTAAIQSAIDAAAKAGGGTVVVPNGTFLSGAVFFRPGVGLRIDAGGVLKGSEEILDYPLLETRIEGESGLYFAALVNADGCDGFSVSGAGTIDGSGGKYWKRILLRGRWNRRAENKDEQRPRLVYVSNSRNVRIAGVTLKNSAFWTTHLYKCEDVVLEDLRIFTEVVDGVRGENPDAIDLDGGRRVTVRRVFMDVPNDAITLKGGKGPDAHDPAKSPQSAFVEDVTIEDCTFGAQCTGCLTFGSECVRAERVAMRNCRVADPVCVMRLKMRPDTRQTYRDVSVSGITGTCGHALVVAPYSSHQQPGWEKLRLKSVAENVAFDVGALVCRKGVSSVAKSDDYELKNVRCK